MRKFYFTFAAIIIGSLIWTFSPAKSEARINFERGYYTNLYGSGENIDGGGIDNYTGDADCDPRLGTCFARNKNNPVESFANVQKYTCNGKTTHCDYNHSPQPISLDYGMAYSVSSGAQCGQTIQLDVFDKSNNLRGYMTWYSGDCVVPTATPMPTQAPTQAPTTTPTQAPVPTATPTRVPTVAPVPTVPVINAEVRCPDGFVRTISGSNIICMQQIQNQTQSVISTANASTGPINVSLAGVPQGAPVQFVPVEVKQPVVVTQELPKTGLPLVAWAFSGLAPIGLKLKRFGSTKPEGNSILALWQEREFLRS